MGGNMLSGEESIVVDEDMGAQGSTAEAPLTTSTHLNIAWFNSWARNFYPESCVAYGMPYRKV